ncbi:uncharacterized protein LOC119679931 isoform X1 [Teleopsis dalmanni]|uniref:uncharacterized protein LOC119679931 isoform X1 n=1 Tax=Teleopsis dalmanni TaxID=139649 RepID=UPI000D32AA16|nr:uncharacterized protein LOC119679931 isoform X1 [Teleopsis dalmanni]
MFRLGSTFFILQAILIAASDKFVQAQDIAVRHSFEFDELLNITSRTDDLININNRVLANHIATDKDKIDAFKSGYEELIWSIGLDALLLELKYREFDNYVRPLQVISDFTKHCVQKFLWQLPNLNTVKTNLNSCVSSASSYIGTIISNAVSTQNTLISYYNSNFKTLLANCKKLEAQSHLNYTICLTEAMATAHNYFMTNRKTLEIRLAEAQCTARNRIRQAVDCRFPHIYSTIEKIGIIKQGIDDCITYKSGFTTPTCSNYIKLDQSPEFFHNFTIYNPFYGFSNTTKCVQVDFLEPERVELSIKA